jgi:hypothetical protein
LSGRAKTIIKKELAVEPGDNVRLVLPVDTGELRYGLYEAWVEGRWKDRARVGIIPPPLQASENPPRLGICLYGLQDRHLDRGDEVIELMKRLGIRAVKLHIGWPDVQPQKDVWQWEKIDRNVELFHKAGFFLGAQSWGTPPWATTGTADKKAGGESAGSLLYPPKDAADWDVFMKKAAARYKGRLAFFEVWNEASMPWFWRGSADDFLRIVQGASKAFRSESPGTKLLVSGFDRVNPFAEKVWKQAFAEYDVASIHYETKHNNVRAAHKVLDPLGGKPIWNSESGGVGFNNFQHGMGNPIKNIAENLARGVDRIFVYKYYVQNRQDPKLKKRLGMVMMGLEMELLNGKALFFRTASDMFDRAVFEKKTEDGKREEYWFRKGAGKLIVAWDKNGTDLTLPKKVKRIVDAYGNALPVKGPTLKLDEYPVFVESE